MHIVDTIARKIKPEAFRSFYFEPEDIALETIKREYQRSAATATAVRVLKIAALERPCAVAEITRELCPPGFFDGQWMCSNPEINEHVEACRTRAIEEAECLAHEIFKLALKTRDLKKQLYEFDMAGCRNLGVLDDPLLRDVVAARNA